MGQVLRGLPWKRISAVTAALFGVTMAIILAFELTTGRAVSTYTGGTSESNVGSSIPGFSARANNSIGGSTERPEQQDPAPVQQEQQDPAPVEEQQQDAVPVEQEPQVPAPVEEDQDPAPIQEPEGAPEPAPNPAPEPAPNPEPNPASKQPAQEQAPQE